MTPKQVQALLADVVGKVDVSALAKANIKQAQAIIAECFNESASRNPEYVFLCVTLLMQLQQAKSGDSVNHFLMDMMKGATDEMLKGLKDDDA